MAVPTDLVHYPGNSDRVTVDRSYFDALVRRANLHNSCHVDPASIAISRIEYDSLLGDSRDYQALRNALLAGGVTMDVLDTLVNPDPSDVRAFSEEAGKLYSGQQPTRQPNVYGPNPAAVTNLPRRERIAPPSYNDGRSFSNGNVKPRGSMSWRRVSDPDSALDNADYEGENDLDEYATTTPPLDNLPSSQPKRTLYFVGLSERTTFADFMSIVKGGKVANAVVRHDCALVTFHSGAAEFLAWSKRNDIYLQGKRIEVKWADRQFRIHNYIDDKIARGATRNLLIRNAAHNGLDEQRIRSDMDHISNLIIIEVKWRGANACVYTNSVGHAITARACMISRNAYKGCVEYLADECDIALPQRTFTPFVPPAAEARKNTRKTSLPNRFGLLNTEGTEADSDEENQDPNGDSSEDGDLADVHCRSGVRLDFLESED